MCGCWLPFTISTTGSPYFLDLHEYPINNVNSEENLKIFFIITQVFTQDCEMDILDEKKSLECGLDFNNTTAGVFCTQIFSDSIHNSVCSIQSSQNRNKAPRSETHSVILCPHNWLTVFIQCLKEFIYHHYSPYSQANEQIKNIRKISCFLFTW